MSGGLDTVRESPPNAVVVFVHGVLSSSSTWKSIPPKLEADSAISEQIRIETFDYASPAMSLRLSRRIPDYDIIARSLSTFLDNECRTYSRVILVAHSQGGLIVQRMLAQMLDDGRGFELQRIRSVILLACPNNGSDFLLLLRRFFCFFRHAQAATLIPYEKSVIATQKRILTKIVGASEVSTDRCPIPFEVYAAESDNIVKPESALGLFPNVGALPGDHTSVLKTGTKGNRTFPTVREALLRALSNTKVPKHATETGHVLDYGPNASGVEGVWPRVEVKETVVIDPTGRRRVKIRSRLVLQNFTGRAVHNVDFNFDDKVKPFDVGSRLERPVETMPPGASLSFPLIFTAQSATEARCTVTWSYEDGLPRQTSASVRR
ncbi:alpha/beta hydrolase [Mycobacterium sp. MBM]|nr:alpha/beta hydrolase [Mycobacterium sp. MBM]